MSNVRSESAFEASIEAHLLANGWDEGTAGYDVALGLMPIELAAFVAASQPEEWEQLSLRLGGPAAATAKVAQYVAKQLTDRGTVDVLRRETKMNGVAFRVAFFAPANGLTASLWERYRANRLTVVRQLHHSESKPGDSLDMTLFVNGIPTATAELKNPLTQQTVAHAMKQYQQDRNPNDLIFRHRAVVHFAVDPNQVYMTTRLAGDKTRFLPFNQGSGGSGQKGGAGNPVNPAGYETAYLWERVWHPDAWLGLLGEFVHVEDVFDDDGKKTGETRTLFPRFHQWDAVQKLLAATRAAGPGVNRLVQHSAGSGKSNTIAWTAHHLSRLHTPSFHGELTDEVKAAALGVDQPIFNKVIVITDRVVLDRQLQATVAGFEHTPGTIVKIDEDSQQLRAALAGHTARIIITTLQKFPVVAEMAAQDVDGNVAGQRFAVIVDEAHSSTSGDAMKDLKKVLSTGGGDSVLLTEEEAANPLSVAETAEAKAEAETPDATDVLAASMTARGAQKNLAFFAFTATPKPKTLELFGDLATGSDGEPVRVPFHLYSMRQAIEEEFILDVLANYTTYDTYYRLANTEPTEDPDVPVSKASAALARFVSLHPTNLAQKAEIIVEHFRQKTAGKIGGRAKAMVVTRSRLHAVRYKQAIDAYITKKRYDTGPNKIATLVAFSGTVTDPAQPTVAWTEPGMNGFGEAQLPKRFASDDYQVLVVAEKYQTGFDQPLLHTMYVDKKLAGVKAVQTLSRLNRTHPGKADTFVLDFANSAEEIQDAFAPFFEQSSAAPTDPNVLYGLELTIKAAQVIHPDEQAAAVAALLSGSTARQKDVYANLNPAANRFVALPEDEQRDSFRQALKSYVRAYSFLAQVMPWTDRDLESLYLYGRALLPLLPTAPDEPLPQISDSVLLTHLRTEAQAQEENIALTTGTDEPGVALPGGGIGKKYESPVEKLSQLIATLNDKFGMNLTDADKVWFEQQKQAVKENEHARVVALNNDRDQYRVVLEKIAEDAIIERHESNGQLFNAFFDKPGFREKLLEYLAESYDEIREEGEAS
ncbi:type I restriction endonuclease [Jatrophihabitans cynanchi]|uniref:Type I restriction endonuclease n=1 Tax=Jatrophihabitans cynanchi TaxID=2944128 RepID=A0ABY7JV07_9ACTN|nr:type I restriction endonuclease [Jatrophihabitans sp. SB3-54]WAX55528.1 type I restriction endonuclease [Jatrophihabitans sp. SB3-54]